MPLGLGLMRRRRMAGGAAGPVGILDAYLGAAFAIAPDVLIYSAHSVTDDAVGSQTEGDTGAFTVRVRRSSDNAVRSFTYSEVGDGTLITWVGAGNDGFVECAYDQGTGGNHAVQATAANQPKIVDAGVLVVENGKVALGFDGVDDNLATATNVDFTGVSSIFIAGQSNLISDRYYFDGKGTNNRVAAYSYIANSRYQVFSTSNGGGLSLFDGLTKTTAGSNNLLSIFKNGSSSALFENGAANGTGTLTTDSFIGLTIGARFNNVQNYVDRFRMFLVYPSNQSTNRTQIETILNNTYNIY